MAGGRDIGTGSVIVPYASIQQAFEQDPAALHDAVYQTADKAAGGDPGERTRLIAALHDGMAAVESEDQGPDILSTPRSDIGSRLQSLVAQQASAAGQLDVVQPATTVRTPAGESLSVENLTVKFDSDDLVGWLGTAWKIIFKPDRHPWVAPSPVPQPIGD